MSEKYSLIDTIPILVFKAVFGELLTYIADIIKRYFLQGVFPSKLKHSTVILVNKCKSLDSEDINNYGPISNTSTLAEIIEKTALARIVIFSSIIYILLRNLDIRWDTLVKLLC